MPVKKMLSELQELHRDLLAFGNDVADAVTESLGALHEPHLHALAPEPAWGEALNERNHRVVERGQRIALLYQPVASDFQQVTAILRAAAELEQIGHLTTEITERAAHLAALLPLPERLSQMGESVSDMIHVVLDAYACHDTVQTRRMSRTRAEVADGAECVTEWLTGAMKADPAAVEPGLGLFTVVRNLQAIANHATRLAEALLVVENGSSNPAARTAGTEVTTLAAPRLATGGR